MSREGATGKRKQKLLFRVWGLEFRKWNRRWTFFAFDRELCLGFRI